MDILKPRRKRIRHTSVCTSCHLKKKKCDRRNPCGTCLRSGRGSLCRYKALNDKELLSKDHPSINTDISRSESLPYITEISPPHLPDGGDSKFNMIEALNTPGHDLTIPRMKGMLPHVSFVNSDPTTGLIRFLLKNAPKRMYEAIFWRDTYLSEEMVLTFENKWKSQPGSHFLPKPAFPHDNEELDRLRASVSRLGQGVGILFHSSISYILEALVSQVQEVLPPADTIIFFVEAFFAHDCAGFPIIDEIAFKESLQHILSIDFRRDTSSAPDIRIGSTNDLAIIATLMFVMRFGYLCLLNFPDCHHEHEVYFKRPISIDVINVGEHIVKEISSSFDVYTELLQAQAIRLLYHYLCPEGDSFTDDGEVGMFMGNMVLMVEALHLNDVQYVENSLVTPVGSAQFRGNFVHSVMLLDVELSVLYGRTPKICQTSAPFPGTSNFGSIIPLVELLHHLIKSTLSPGFHIESQELIRDIAALENLLMKVLGKPEDYLNQNLKDNMKLTKFRLLILCSCFILMVYYALYIHAEYNMKYSASAFYFEKAARAALGDLVCIQRAFPRVCNSYFGAGSLIKISPLLFACTRMKLVVSKVGYRAYCSIKLNPGIERLKMISIKHILAELEEDAAGIYDELLKGFRLAWLRNKSYKYAKLALACLDTFDGSIEPISQAVLNYGSNEIDTILCSVTKHRDEHRIYKEFFAVDVKDTTKPDEQEIMDVIQVDRMWNLVGTIRTYIKELDLRRLTDKHEIAVKMPGALDFDFFENLLSM